MEKLIEGVRKFQKDVYPEQRELFRSLASGQKPKALFITCADSRVVPQLITQCEPGDLFICRNAGNMVPAFGDTNGGVSATIEYAVAALGIEHIIICGHSDCGAMKGILKPEAVKEMPTVAHWLHYGEAARRIVMENHRNLPESRQLSVVTHENVAAQLANLRTHPSVAVRIARGRLQLHGWMYHIETGDVEVYDEIHRRFVAFDEAYDRAANLLGAA